VVLLDQPVNCPAMRRQVTDRRRFILAHEAAVAVDIGAQDRSELAFHP
jgi:hypothetical protein